MAQPDGSLVFDTKIITTGFNKGMAAIKTAAKGIGAITAGFAAATGAALKFAGELEQNLGGSEAVFKQYASTIQKTADTAFKNMGLSTSDFLATANKMGALFQGSGFQIQESAELSAKTMQRAADVASIMGIDISMAMESIAGAAKGNFTMMDNLGVAMNDTTLAAYALEKGIAKSTRQMTNQEKIGLAMQMFLEKTEYATGNYAKENETLAGSLATAKAALENFLAGTGKAEDLAESLSGAAGVIIENIGELTPKLAAGLSDVFAELAPMMPSMLEQLVDGVLDGADELADSFGDMFSSLVTIAAGSAPDILDASMLLMESFIDGIVDNSDDVAAVAIEVGEAVISGFVKIVPKAVSAAGEIAEAFADELGKAYPIFKPFTSIVKLLADNVELCTAAFIAFKVATTGFAVLQGLTASFQTANLQLALFTLQNGKAALSSTTLTAALTAKELVVGVLTGKINLLTAAQTLLNKAWAANPVGVVIGGAVALGVALHALYQFTNQETEAEKEHRMALEANKAAVTELTEVYDEYHKRNSTEANDGLASIENLQRLSRELDALVDSNGKVQEADEARVKFILGELNGALGTEAQLVNGVVQNYKDLKTAVEESLKAKQAEILMEEATKNYTEACKNYAAAEKAVAEARKNEIATDEESVRVRKDAEAELLKYTNDKIAYAKACSLAEEGQTEALINYLEQQRNARNEDLYDLEKYNSEHDKQLARKAEDYNRHINTLITLIRGFDGSKEMQDELDAVFADLKIDEEKIAELGGSIEDGLIKGFENGEDYFSAAWTNDILAEVATSAIKSGETFSDEFIKNLCKHLSGNTATTRPFDEFKTVVESTFPDLFKSPMILQSSETNGSEAANYYVQGAVNYANSAEAHQKTYNAYFALGQTGDKGFNDGSGVHSPSVFAEAAAKFYVEGAVLGIKGNADMLYDAVKMLGEEMNDVFEDSLTSQMNSIRSEIASITGLIKEEAEKNVKAFDAELKKIEMLRDFGIDDEETYYRKLEFLRDNYLTKNSDKWIDITQELYDYQEAQLEEHRDNIEDVYDDIADHITDKLDEVAKKQQKFSDSLTDSTELFQKYTIDGVVHYKLNDFSSDNANLAAYQQWLSKAMDRVKSSGASEDAINGVLDYIDGLAGDESGMDALVALASASDADFAKFMSGYAQNLSRADGIAAQRYSDDMVTAAEESYQQMVDELAKAGLDIPEGFFVSGTLSAQQFGEAFLSEIELQMQEIRKKLTEFNAEINASIGAAAGNVTNDNRSTTYHIYGDNSNNTVKQIQNMETIKRLSGQ